MLDADGDNDRSQEKGSEGRGERIMIRLRLKQVKTKPVPRITLRCTAREQKAAQDAESKQSCRSRRNQKC